MAEKTDSLGHTNGCWEDNFTMTVSNLTDTVVNVMVTDSNLNITTSPSTINPIASGYEFTNCPPIVSISENQPGKGEIEIYPNPSHDYITVSFSNIKHILVLSTIGAVVKFSNKSDKTIYVGDLTPGLYLLRVTDKSVIGQTARFIVE